MWVLRSVGLLYLLSGLWCALEPELASGFLGFGLGSRAAQVEFFAVYGGLQFGLALAMLLASAQASLVRPALLFSLVFSVSLVSFRLIAMLRYGSFTPELWMMVGLEFLIVAAFCFSLLKQADSELD